MKTAVVALHDPEVTSFVESVLGTFGYAVHAVRDSSVDALVDHCASTNPQVVVMELNFTTPGGDDYSPARRVYHVLSAAVSRGDARFYGVSGLPNVVEGARAAGIPAYIKPDLGSKLITELKPAE